MENIFRISKFEQVLIQIFLLIWAFIVIIPLYIAVTGSLKNDTGQVMSDPFGLAPRAASGRVTVQGEPGSVIPAETLLVHTTEDGRQLRFATVNETVLRGPSAPVVVQARFNGPEGNLFRDAVLSFVEPVDGIEPEAVVAAAGRRGGFLAEAQGRNGTFITLETRVVFQDPNGRLVRAPVQLENVRITNGRAVVYIQPSSQVQESALQPGDIIDFASPKEGVEPTLTFLGFRGLSGGGGWRFGNYATAWTMAEIGTYFKNSVIIAFFSLIIVLTFATMTSFILARMPFFGSKWVFLCFMVGLIIPIRLAMAPIFWVVSTMGLLDSHWSVILVMSASLMPTAVFILTSFFKGLSPELEQAAKMDGASPFQIYYSVVLPLVKPAVATVALLTFVWTWNEYYWPLVFLQSKSMHPLTVGLQNFNTQFATQWHLMFAGIMIMIIPTIVAFLLASKQFISGLTQGGVKE